MKASEILAARAHADAYLASISRRVHPDTPLDVTDFGLGDFPRTGLVARVLVNRRQYCSKWLIQQEEQVCPPHFHRNKVEDIACEGGRILMTLWGTADLTVESGGNFDHRALSVDVELNGRSYGCCDVDPERGLNFVLGENERVHVPNGLWHSFQPIGGSGLGVEVSTWNDDAGDNVFADERINRFVAEIEQDLPGTSVTIGSDGFISIVTLA